MRLISLQQIETLLSNIVGDREKESQQANEKFAGVTAKEVFDELRQRIGEDWALKKMPYKFTREDINAIANSRFYRRAGMKILMIWAIVILVLIQAANFLPGVPIVVLYALMAVSSVGFLYYFSKKQKESRQEMWRDLEGDIGQSHDEEVENNA